MTNAEKHRRKRAGGKAAKLKHIAILDMETDPFDADRKAEILPFAAELYSDQFGAIVIWDENLESFINKLYEAIINLPDSYTIYAHNGGKFDFMFLVHKLRGLVKFKGRALMSARIGNHELRDSLHILPEKLAAWKKDHFDYSKMKRANRHKFRAEILAYLHSDCVYLFDIVKSFVGEFGLKISIGQAAFTELKKSYKVQRVSEQSDEFLRRYFFGGRVECIAGRGIFDSERLQHLGGFKLYDVNSMYPYSMANFAHPFGNEYNWRRGNPESDTVFIDVVCRSHGAFVRRETDTESDVSYSDGRQKYFVSKWEFDVALKYDLIEDIEITGVVDCRERTDFSKFILPMYDRRQLVKADMRKLRDADKQETTDYEELKKQDLFLKYLLNNSFGKFAQNPRNFKEYYYTDYGDAPPKDWFDFLADADDETKHQWSFPVERGDGFMIWARPSPGRRYNNVGTAASITGAARAILLEAIQNSVEPIYCDTDSLFCRDLKGVEISPSKLGAWDIEKEFEAIAIAGKKTYCAIVKGKPDGHADRLYVRSKGVDLRVKPERPDASAGEWQRCNDATWQKYKALIDGAIIEEINKAPTMTKAGYQRYITRRIQSTAPRLSVPTIKQNRSGLRSIAI